jgi:glycerol-3-phosphate acyltransferase PlsY
MLAFIIIASYLIGSIPTAYIITRLAGVTDLRSAGSGNIGARNAFEVTGKKQVGAIVLIIDVLKGFLPVMVLYHQSLTEYIPLSSLFIIIGHCYPIWLRFHGGRGLASACGMLILLDPFTVIIWSQAYILFSMILNRSVRENIQLFSVELSSVIASVIVSLMVIVRPTAYHYSPLGIRIDDPHLFLSLRESILMIIVVILTSHHKPLRNFIRKSKIS